MLDKLIALVANELSVPKEGITVATHIQDDLGADSLDAVELIMAIEDAFKISVPESEANNLKTVGDLLRFIEKNQ